jgi:hypothetical protein
VKDLVLRLTDAELAELARITPTRHRARPAVLGMGRFASVPRVSECGSWGCPSSDLAEHLSTHHVARVAIRTSVLSLLPLLPACQREGARPGPGSSQVSFAADRIALDFRVHEMEIRGTLSKPTGTAAPARAWVWSYFINPSEGQGSRSDEPIEVQPHFIGDTAEIIARGPFHWATNEEAPRAGYYARVSVSIRSPDDARVPTGGRNFSIPGAMKVHSILE